MALRLKKGDLNMLSSFLDKIDKNNSELMKKTDNAYNYTIENFDREKVLQQTLNNIKELL